MAGKGSRTALCKSLLSCLTKLFVNKIANLFEMRISESQPEVFKRNMNHKQIPNKFLEYLSRADVPPMLMGILNVNPDSFSDGGRYQNRDAALSRARQMVSEGATIIDVGGESTRPGAEAIDVDTEWQRIGPVLMELCHWLAAENPVREASKASRIWLSVDSYKAEIARRSLELSADIIINDVSGGCSEPAILDIVARNNASYILMHNPFVLPQYGAATRPHARKDSISYADPLRAVAAELRQLYDCARATGCQNIVLDPGLGFGKDCDCNWQLLARLSEFLRLLEPLIPQAFVLVGASNKRFVRHWQEQEEAAAELQGRQQTDPIPPADTYQRFLSANLAACTAAVLGGARIVRSHETLEHYRSLRSSWELRKQQLAASA